MEIVRAYGKPHYFLTFTCNPRWKEFEDLLPGGMAVHDRPDIVNKVFHKKLRDLVDDLLNKHVLGVVKGMVYSIEFQKRGLPHAHMLLIMEKPLYYVTQVDAAVCAELPEEVDSDLWKTVTNSMIHSCGDRGGRGCLDKNGKCTRNYPKPFASTTTFDDNKVPNYRRRPDGRTVKRWGKTFDNRHVVPYNPYLTAKYDAHLNLEVVASVHAVKYIYKYIFKGRDQLRTELKDVYDETAIFMDNMYITASEAHWRLIGYPDHFKNVSVIDLDLHLEGQQVLHYAVDGTPRDLDNAERAIRSGGVTKLTAWLALNARQDDVGVFARSLLYQDIPQHFAWKQQEKQWSKRARDTKQLGLLPMVPPNRLESWYLRMLLTHVRGPKSWCDLRTYRGRTYPTYEEVCMARGLLENPREYYLMMEEVVMVYTSPTKVIEFFSMMISMANPPILSALYSSCLPLLRKEFENLPLEYDEQLSEAAVKVAISESLGKMNPVMCKTLFDAIGPPTDEEMMRLQTRGTKTSNRVPVDPSTLNDEQKHVYDVVTQSESGMFMLDAPGGTGKTYTLRCIIDYFGEDNCCVVASTGIAAIMLPSATTAHYRFKLPLDLEGETMPNLQINSKEARNIKECKIIVWDEVVMMSRYGVEAVDKFLKGITGVKRPFGGKRVLFSGDFRQILPIVSLSSRDSSVRMSLKCSYLWKNIRQLSLKINMRVLQGESNAELSEWCENLLEIGEGRARVVGERQFEPEGNGDIELPKTVHVVRQLDELIGKVLGANLAQLKPDVAILAPLNEQCALINDLCIARLPGPLKTYYSFDRVLEDHEANNLSTRHSVPLDLLHGINDGLPPHELKLKVGAVVMCIRNLVQYKGIMNGTKMVVIRLLKAGVVCRIYQPGNVNDGEEVIIPRIRFHLKGDDYPFNMERKQLPLKLAYGMTVNKSQCQTLRRVGLWLTADRPCFAHGQLYVALSRVASGPRGIWLLNGKQTRTVRNVIYKEIFNQVN